MFYYSLDDFASMGSLTILPEKVFSILNHLENELKSVTIPAAAADTQREVSSAKNRRPPPLVVRKSTSRTKTTSVSASDWEALRSFKPTKKQETAEGSDKIINDIRMMLNKVTQKTYETLKNNVINSIGECLEKHPNTMGSLSKHFFDIVVRDRFLTDIYVDLYLALIAFFPEFETHFKNRVDIYRATIDTMKYADPEKDYDAYCDYVKVNDQRKAMTLFIIQLFKRQRVSADEIINLMKFLLDKTRENREISGRTNEVEEITENFYLTYLHCGILLENESEWSYIIQTIVEFSEMQIGAYPSISSRALLKYQDMAESLDVEDD